MFSGLMFKSEMPPLCGSTLENLINTPSPVETCLYVKVEKVGGVAFLRSNEMA